MYVLSFFFVFVVVVFFFLTRKAVVLNARSVRVVLPVKERRIFPSIAVLRAARIL